MTRGIDSPNIDRRLCSQYVFSHVFGLNVIRPDLIFHKKPISMRYKMEVQDGHKKKNTYDAFKISNKWSEKEYIVATIHL